MKRPTELGPRETLSFVVRHAPRDGRVLDIGCGTGEVAALMKSSGFTVTAIDDDSDNVADARSLGVEAHLAEWPAFKGGPFDAVLCARSLHHIGDLAEAIPPLRAMLAPKGVLLVEEFAWEALDAKGCEWLSQLLKALQAKHELAVDADHFIDEFLRGGGDLYAWQREYRERNLYEWREVQAELKRVFVKWTEERAPFLYRLLARGVSDNPLGLKIVQRTMEAEARLGAAGQLPLIGRRFVARLA